MFDSVYPKIVEDPIVTRLDLSPSALEDRWNAWKRVKEQEARRGFDELLSENSFVEFWGKMRKKVLDEAALKIKEEDELEEGEGMGEGGSADLTAMGRQIDLEEIKAILRVRNTVLTCVDLADHSVIRGIDSLTTSLNNGKNGYGYAFLF